MAVIGFAGMSVAQDVYSAGYYTNTNGYECAAVYKNGNKLHYVSGFDDAHYKSTDVVFFSGDVYWVKNRLRNDGSPNYGDVQKNDNIYLSNPVSSGTYIHDLFFGSNLFAAGYKTTGGVKTAVVWRNDDATPILTLGNGSYHSEAFCGVIANGGYAYTGGYQNTSSSAYKGMIWKDNNVLKEINNAKIFDIAHYDGKLYFVGREGTTLKVWYIRTDGTDFTTLYTLLSTGASDRASICLDAGDVYVCSYGGNSPDVLWKNGTQLYSTPGYFYAVAANTNGVYIAGAQGGGGKIWKDGPVLYSPSDCEFIYGMYIAEPECTNSSARSLPFTDGFENGNTSWPCWTKLDVDNNNGGNHFCPFWARRGPNNGGEPATGNHYAYHGWGVNAQEGWLISPRLFLQPGRDNTTLTFKTREPNTTDIRTVWVSTTNTNPSSFTKVWTQNNPSYAWKTVTVDLAAYQGHAVYIAFKYTGTDGHGWGIDDVSVTENWATCSNQSVPYSSPFSSNIGSCWYIVDEDMSGDKRCWQYNSSEQCAYHPYGQSGIAQYGYLYSPNITLPAGHDYVLKFKTKSTSSGSGRSNKIWVRTDGTGIPESNDYRDEIWSDNQFSSSWTDVEVPLSQFAGHVISLEFNYQGTYAHNWFIKDVRVEEAIAQYTITANSNNNAWGTVTGGGTYNNGATCTLTATPASGYQFQNWKKNGTIVSTNANYSFTVTENATYTATFGAIPINYYTITTAASPTVGGIVTGGGTFQEGSSTTLTATANTGYSFSKWQDNNTQNPRTITVTQDATYTATFTQDHYTVSVYASPTHGGTVSGGGSNFTYGSTATLTATPADGYEFQGWNDGNTDNPREVTVFGNVTYTATFGEVGTTYYTVTTNVTPEGSGTVEGGGTYEAGTNIVLTATANTGYTFSQWSDGNTQNPRTVTVTDNLSFTAQFTQNQYTITVVADPSNGGTVSGGGNYYYGQTATLRATANSGYEFVGWSDGSTESQHTVTVTGNATYKATFTQSGSTTYYTVTAYASPTGSGSVTGTGVFAAGSTTTLRATPNNGYNFERWNDGNTQNPRTVTVNNNMSFTAYFTSDQYTLSTMVAPAGSGTVTGGGSYAHGAMAILTAIPNSGYEFLQWSDGNRRNPRTIRVTQDATYTALFTDGTGTIYTVTVTSNDPSLGEVFGGGNYPGGTVIEISAFPNASASFLKWNDGNTDNPRTVVVESDLEFMAEFVAMQTYTLTVESANPDMGRAYGSGQYEIGTVVEISAVPYDGYVFTSWNDGNTDNPRSITVTGDATYMAHFEANSSVAYTLMLFCNTSEGTVSGGGSYVAGSMAFIQAIPFDGFAFDKWSDGDMSNPREILMTGDLTLVAFFKGVGIDENEASLYAIYPNPARESIRIEGIEANTSVEIYNSLGEIVKVVSANPDKEIGISDLAAGLYLVRFGNVSLRFVKTL